MMQDMDRMSKILIMYWLVDMIVNSFQQVVE